MTLQQLKYIVAVEKYGSFGKAAAFVKQCGFGMVMIHAGHGWGLAQFISRYANTRKDRWGGPELENRMRLPLAVIESVRKAVGPGFPIEVRISASECYAGGYDIDEGEYIRLRGVDFGAGAKVFSIAAASLGRCTITLRLDSETGPVVGTVNMGVTGSLDTYKQFSAKVRGANSVHDLYLCFSNVEGDIHLDYWSFKQ